MIRLNSFILSVFFFSVYPSRSGIVSIQLKTTLQYRLNPVIDIILFISYHSKTNVDYG